MFNFSTLPPLSLYIHFPWCVKKCPYCDFNSHELKGDLPEQAYVDALVRDLEQDLPLVWGRRINSVFMGGGTPGLFSPESLNRLLSELRARLQISPDIEITLEANPGAIDEQKFNEFFSIGINRLSIGVQSFDDGCLQSLGRIHDAAQASSAIEIAKKSGFDNLNIDLMFGLPGQDASMAKRDVESAMALLPSHISYYQLTLEPNTLFHAHPPVLPAEEQTEQVHEHGKELLASQGYVQYEVSAFAQAGRQCRHNLNYWRFGDYLGIGAGAHAKISNASEQSVTRYWKIKHPKDYMATLSNEKSAAAPESAAHIGGRKRLGMQDAGFEFMLNALRLTEGFDSSLFGENTGLPILHVEKQLKQAKLQDLIHWDRDRIMPTARGQRYLNDLLELFLPDSRVRDFTH